MSVDLQRNGQCAVITLNRPEALNALSFSILREIGEAFDKVKYTDPSKDVGIVELPVMW